MTKDNRIALKDLSETAARLYPADEEAELTEQAKMVLRDIRRAIGIIENACDMAGKINWRKNDVPQYGEK